MRFFTPECYIGLTINASQKYQEGINNSDDNPLWNPGVRVLQSLMEEKNLLSGKKLDILRKPAQKPAIVSPEGWYYNVSHSSHLLAVVVANEEVGIDIEMVKNRDPDILNTPLFFSEIDRNFFSNNPDNYSITKLWTLKESWIKLNGLSVWDMHKAPYKKSNNKEGMWSGEVHDDNADTSNIYVLTLRMRNGHRCIPQILQSHKTITWLSTDS